MTLFFKSHLLGRALAVFLFCLLLTGCESRKTIVNGLDEKDANEIAVYLAGRGIDAQKVRGEVSPTGQGAPAFDITVKEQDALQAMVILNQAGLPRRKPLNLLNIFQNTGLVPTEMTEKIRYEAGRAEQIASTIRKIDGVLDAEVQLAFPEEDPLNPGKTKGDITASVYVKHSGILDDPNAHAITKVKRLVSSSIPGLKYDNVTVILDKALNLVTSGSFVSPDEQKQYVVVWTMVLAKESVTRFRIVFFTFCVLLLLLVLLLVWFIWKTYPLMQQHGGFREFFHLKSAPQGEKPAEKPKEPAKTASPAEKTESPADSKADFEGDIEFEEDEKK